MNNFFTELEKFIEYIKNETDKSKLFFEYRGSKISGDLAEEIWNVWGGANEYIDRCNETMEEQSDFIRLLREENKKLRGECCDGD